MEKNISSKNVDKMFSMLNQQFQQNVPMQVFKQTSDNNLFPLGVLKSKFESFSNGVSYYKMSGMKDTILMGIMVDNDNKISSLFFKPYPSYATKDHNDAAFQTYVKLINDKNYDKMYEMINDLFKQKFPFDKFKSVYEELIVQGKLRNEFESFAAGINKYKVYNTKDSLTMTIGLDNTGKIETFWMSPYQK